jgi:dolichol-phosphate mannosyltransferase
MLATYNEADSIPFVLAEIAEAVEKLTMHNIECRILLVDDRSPDNTAVVAEGAARRLGLELEVLSGNKNGLGNAILRGFSHGLLDQPDFFVTLDADGQHDARQMPDLVRAYLATRSDIMIGSRWTLGGESPGTTRMRALLSRGGNMLFRIVTGTRDVQDATTSFRIIRADVASTFRPDYLDISGYAFFSAFIALAFAQGYKIGETPIVFRPRFAGISKLTVKDCATFARNLFRTRTVVEAIRVERARNLHQDHAASAIALRSSFASQ